LTAAGSTFSAPWDSPIYHYITEMRNMVVLASTCTIKRLRKKPILPLELLHILKCMLISSDIPALELDDDNFQADEEENDEENVEEDDAEEGGHV
jgi:hypothetical protein